MMNTRCGTLALVSGPPVRSPAPRCPLAAALQGGSAGRGFCPFPRSFWEDAPPAPEYRVVRRACPFPSVPGP